MALVTISRHFGAGGQTLGEKLCDRFGFHLVDASVIDELAQKAKLSPKWLAAMEKEASSTLLSIISSIVSRGIFYKKPGAPADRDDRQKYLSFLNRIFTAMANEGDYVIVGRGAQLILKDHPRALNILLVADIESRISFLMDHYKVSRSEAESTIRAKERERAALGSRLFEADMDDVSLYHMILNTGRMPLEWVLETVSGLVTHLKDRNTSG